MLQLNKENGSRSIPPWSLHTGALHTAAPFLVLWKDHVSRDVKIFFLTRNLHKLEVIMNYNEAREFIQEVSVKGSLLGMETIIKSSLFAWQFRR